MSEKSSEKLSRDGWPTYRTTTTPEIAEKAVELAPRYGAEVEIVGREGDEYVSPGMGITDTIFTIGKGRVHIQVTNARDQRSRYDAYRYFWERIMKWGERKSFKRVKKV